MRFLPIAFLLIFKVAFAQQNLLPNGGFEDANICEKNVQCGPSGWNMYERNYDIKYRSDACTKPNSGEIYLVFYVLNARNYNDKMFLEAPLICDLQKGKHYTLDFHMKVRNEKYIPLSVFYSSTRNMLHRVNFDDSIPDFEIAETDIVEPVEFPTKKWIHFKKSFVANGNEKYFVMGNFKKYSKTKSTIGFGRLDIDESKVYYNIDDISLVCNDCDADCNNYSEALEQIYKYNVRHRKLDTVSISIINNYFESKLKSDTIIIPDVLFKFDSGVFNEAYYKVLDSFILNLSKHDFEKLKIIGHTDNKGSDAYNLKLSLIRAKEVAKYFVSKQLINESNIEAVGLGARNPIASNSTEEGRRKNRRVEIILLKN